MAKEVINYLEKQIKNFQSMKQEMKIGRRYFLQQNDILDREKKKVVGKKDPDTNEMIYHNINDTSRANHKLPSGFVKLQSMQKVNYLIDDEITLTQDEDVYDELLPDWKKMLKQTAIMATQKIYEAWQPYVEDGELKFKRIPGDELIIEFESRVREKEKRVIRHYKKRGVEKAEIWNKERIVKLEKNKNSKWKVVETRKHILNQKVNSNDEVVEETEDSYGFIPLVILYNNDDLQTDTKPIKQFVDAYDITNSDFMNNIDDFQEILMVIKGYAGSNPARVLNKLKQMGGVNVDSEGDVDYKQAKIPVEARKEALKQLRKDIFDAGMAVDTDRIATGNVTNNIIAAMYENLNMKANQFEQELQDFWRKLNKVINRYFEITNDSRRVEGELIFDRTMLVNQKEKSEEYKLEVEAATKLMGMVDNKLTANILSNLDFIKDKSDMTEEQILQSLNDKSDEFMIQDE